MAGSSSKIHGDSPLPPDKRGSVLCCLKCGGDLEVGQSQVQCLECDRQWPALLGIPDFRERGGNYIRRDLEQAEALAEAFASKNRNELVVLSVEMGSFYQDEKASSNLRLQRIRNRQQWQTNSQVIATRLTQLKSLISFQHKNVAADVGCGSGSYLPALSEQYQQVVGVDASMSELILARKLLEETGLTNVRLACTFAENLPIRTQTVDFGMALYVLEHVISAPESLTEIFRILKPGGHFYFAVPFRYTWVPPEPHTHVWWVGWLPRRWQAGYVRFFKPDFDFEKIHLFSFREIGILAARLGHNRLQFFDPGFDRSFPPARYKQQRLWKFLSKFGPLLALVKIFFRQSIHAIMTRLPGG
jgi:SAM-dependent methyltransferase